MRAAAEGNKARGRGGGAGEEGCAEAEE
uniref:Uncharacterized protein MANES_08G031800 n=1 Tax=Rhizophora mucronata TaxID=61149 RepID=A0A2P2ITM7_RHIMU